MIVVLNAVHTKVSIQRCRWGVVYVMESVVFLQTLFLNVQDLLHWSFRHSTLPRSTLAVCVSWSSVGVVESMWGLPLIVWTTVLQNIEMMTDNIMWRRYQDDIVVIVFIIVFCDLGQYTLNDRCYNLYSYTGKRFDFWFDLICVSHSFSQLHVELCKVAWCVGWHFQSIFANVKFIRFFFFRNGHHIKRNVCAEKLDAFLGRRIRYLHNQAGFKQ